MVITGTSTGIGEATAIRLADEGFSVFAGVRQLADGEALRKQTSHEVIPLIIDITDGAAIASAVEAVTKAVGDAGLAGLVNNAGIVKPGPIEFQPLADFRRQLEVNLVGHVAVTQAFLPLIRRGHGRIVNVGSIGGRLVLPLHGAYSASKFGMEAISDALRIELRQWSIPVSLVDPGASATAIFGKTLAAIDDVKRTLDERGERAYDEQIERGPAPGRKDRRRRRSGFPRREGGGRRAHVAQAQDPVSGRQGRASCGSRRTCAARPAEGSGGRTRGRPARTGRTGKRTGIGQPPVRRQALAALGWARTRSARSSAKLCACFW